MQEGMAKLAGLVLHVLFSEDAGYSQCLCLDVAKRAHGNTSISKGKRSPECHNHLYLKAAWTEGVRCPSGGLPSLFKVMYLLDADSV